MSKRATLICCYNNPAMFCHLQENLRGQSESVEVLAIDNSDKKFDSCSRAFNSVIHNVATEFVIFSHQDIWVNSIDTIKKFIDDAEKVGTFDIIGVAGKKRGCVCGLGNITQGKDKKRAVEGKINGMQECDTVDECFFGGRVECFQRYPFSETLCNGWHLYAVERCMAALIRGNKVYVSDSNLTHLSGGKIDHAYNVTFYRICKYYKNGIDYVVTTCEDSSTKPILRELSFIKRELHVLKRNFREKRQRRLDAAEEIID